MMRGTASWSYLLCNDAVLCKWEGVLLLIESEDCVQLLLGEVVICERRDIYGRLLPPRQQGVLCVAALHY